MKLRSHQLDSLVAMQQCDKGQIIVPTGGGKTMCMIEDAKYRFGMNSISKRPEHQRREKYSCLYCYHIIYI